MTEPLTMTGAPWTPEPGAIVFLPEEDEVGYTEDEAYAFLSGGAEAVAELQASAAQAFHMPGKHDQKSHGSGGVSGQAALDSPTISVADVHGHGKSHTEVGLSDEEFASIRKYRRNGHIAVNKKLRGEEVGALYEGAVAHDVAQLDGVMARSSLSETVTVQRGTLTTDWLPPAHVNGDLTGLSWRDDGFVSTTANPAVVGRFAGTGVMMHITAPSGTPAVTLSAMNDEGEILLGRGLTFTVTMDNGVDASGIRNLDVAVT